MQISDCDGKNGGITMERRMKEEVKRSILRRQDFMAAKTLPESAREEMKRKPYQAGNQKRKAVLPEEDGGKHEEMDKIVEAIMKEADTLKNGEIKGIRCPACGGKMVIGRGKCSGQITACCKDCGMKMVR